MGMTNREVLKQLESMRNIYCMKSSSKYIDYRTISQTLDEAIKVFDKLDRGYRLCNVDELLENNIHTVYSQTCTEYDVVTVADLKSSLE